MPFIKVKKNVGGERAMPNRQRLAEGSTRFRRHKIVGSIPAMNAASLHPAAPFASASGVVEWRKSPVRPAVSSLARIRKDVRVVKGKLRGLVTEKETRRWLITPNSVLGGLSPLQAIYSGDTGSVLETLAQVEQGIFV